MSRVRTRNAPLQFTSWRHETHILSLSTHTHTHSSPAATGTTHAPQVSSQRTVSSLFGAHPLSRPRSPLKTAGCVVSQTFISRRRGGGKRAAANYPLGNLPSPIQSFHALHAPTSTHLSMRVTFETAECRAKQHAVQSSLVNTSFSHPPTESCNRVQYDSPPNSEAEPDRPTTSYSTCLISLASWLRLVHHPDARMT